MRQIITGGSGFTGGYLAQALLTRGEHVVVFDVEPPKTSGADFVRGDIRSPEDIQRLQLGADDVVFHMAARQFHGAVPHRGRDEWFAEVNVGGTRHLLEAMAAGGAKRTVFFSTDMTYGRPDETPTPPTHPQRPFGPYGRTKVRAEQLLAKAAQEFGLKATVFRPRLIAGAGRLGILAKLFQLIRLGLPVPMIGSGGNHYQMVAVEDCVAAALAAADHDFPSGPFNLGSDDPPTVKQLLGEVIRRAGSHSMLVPTPTALLRPTLSLLDNVGLTLLYPEQFRIADLDYILDTRTTRAELGWAPTRGDVDIIFEAYAGFLGK